MDGDAVVVTLMQVEVIKTGPYEPMQSLFDRNYFVLTLRCGHIWSYSGARDGIPDTVNCIDKHDDRGFAALNRMNIFDDPDGLIQMETEVLHEKVLEMRVGVKAYE